MKKNLPVILCVVFSYTAMKSQAPSSAAGGYTLVTDTLHYYFNKYYFNTGTTSINNFPKIKCGATGLTSNGHMSSLFENADSLWISGLEAYAMKGVITANLSVPLRLYLCSVNSSSVPLLPAIDSVDVPLANTVIQMKGGNFTNPRLLTTNYAVLARNVSGATGDTIVLLRTAGLTATNTSASPAQKYADGNYSMVRLQGQFYSTKNLTTAVYYGVGTEYEFMLAPRVQYHLKASQKAPQVILDAMNPTDTICTRIPFTFTNTSSYHYTNRFFNLLELYRKWNSNSTFVAQPIIGGWPADSAISWHFEFYQSNFPPRDPREFLSYKHQGINLGTVSAVTDQPGCHDIQYRARLKTMAPFGRGPLWVYNEDLAVCLKFCFGDVVGLRENESIQKISAYPNPALGGKTLLTGLEKNSLLTLFDITGKLLYSEKISGSTLMLDLNAYSQGIYTVSVLNPHGQRQLLKILHDK